MKKSESVSPKFEEKTIKNISKKLEGKYGRKSNLDDSKVVKNKSRKQKILSIVLISFNVLICVFVLIMCISSFVNSINNSPRMMFGYSTMQISSGSMSAEEIEIKGRTYESGFEIGDKIVVHSVDTHSLNIGDKIVFYAYPDNYIKYHSVNKEELDLPVNKTRYQTSFRQFWGFNTNEIYDASKHNATIVFHHITNVYKDENGKLWFKTQGSANAVKDTWFISEEMIVGIYDDSAIGNFFIGFIDFLSSKIGFILLMLIPIITIIIILVRSIGHQLYLSLIELDVVEQKRKITDEICVKNKVGYFMDTSTKYKVLSQANKKEVAQYVALLWPDGEEPYALNKYVKKKHLVLYPIKKLLTLNQICEVRYNNGEDINKIAEYYQKEKQLIKDKEMLIKQRLKNAHKLVKEKKRITK